jgi:hypothetical protein
MTGYIDPTKEAFAVFCADGRPRSIHMLKPRIAQTALSLE